MESSSICEDKLELAARLLCMIHDVDRSFVIGVLCGRVTTSESYRPCEGLLSLQCEDQRECSPGNSANEYCSCVGNHCLGQDKREQNSVSDFWRKSKGLDSYSLSYSSTQRIASAIADTITIFQENSANSGKSTHGSMFTDSSKILSYIMQLSAAESQLKLALTEDACLKARLREDTDEDELENLGSFDDDSAMDVCFDESNSHDYDTSRSKEVTRRTRKNPFFVLTMDGIQNCFGGLLGGSPNYLPAGVSIDDLFCLCVTSDEFMSSVIPCKNPLFNRP
ncbi:unnamed protein product [Enterobius vermicularis]|uniref:CFEM domain-containing protein n=1 Tax=Enterobius vermicularis TaxID=51028 RepID=A0A0N4V0K9_ENTVE|nr:unnamed protein product [Enterobius vermicularis]